MAQKASLAHPASAMWSWCGREFELEEVEWPGSSAEDFSLRFDAIAALARSGMAGAS